MRLFHLFNYTFQKGDPITQLRRLQLRRFKYYYYYCRFYTIEIKPLQQGCWDLEDRPETNKM